MKMKACEDGTFTQYIKTGIKCNKANYLNSRSTKRTKFISGKE